MSADDMYKMLTIIEKHADELAKLDPSFTQISGGHMAQFQKQALEATLEPRAPSIRALRNTCRRRGVWDKQVGFQIVAIMSCRIRLGHERSGGRRARPPGIIHSDNRQRS